MNMFEFEGEVNEMDDYDYLDEQYPEWVEANGWEDAWDAYCGIFGYTPEDYPDLEREDFEKRLVGEGYSNPGEFIENWLDEGNEPDFDGVPYQIVDCVDWDRVFYENYARVFEEYDGYIFRID